MPERVKQGWRNWRFDQMAVMVNDRIDDPSEANVEHYVRLEHLDSDSLTIRRWGSPSDVEATKLRFSAGDIIFGRRRVYQRKLGVAHFEGICSAHAMVLRAKPEVVFPAFLPFFMQSDLFMERAKQISVGSLSPTINWKTLAKEEFALPPLSEQRRIAEVQIASQAVMENLQNAAHTATKLYAAASSEQFSRPDVFGVKPEDWMLPGWKCSSIESLVLANAPVCYGIVQVRDHDPAGVPTLAIKNLVGDFSTGIHRTNPVIEAQYSRSRVQPGDLLLSIKATIGDAAVVPEGFRGNISRDLARLRFNHAKIRSQYFLHLYHSPRFTRFVNSLVVGSTRSELSIAAIRQMSVPIPQIDEQDRIIEQMNAILQANKDLASRAEHAFRLNRQILEAGLSGPRGIV